MLFRRQLLLAKVETTSGTDSTPTAAANAFLVRDVALSFDVAQLERPVMTPDISNSANMVGRKTVQVTFTAELKGSGVQNTAPKIGTLLKGCGFAETTLAAGAGFDYDPISTGFQTLTIYVYMDGLLHKITGAAGSFNIVAAAGEFALVNFTFQGSYNAPTDTAFPASPAYEATLPPIVEQAALAVHSMSACAQQFTLDVANTINARMCVNAAEGVSGFALTGRNVTGSFNPEATLLATANPFTKLTSGSIGAVTCTVGTANNNKAVITGNVQFTGVNPGDRDGTLIWDIPVRFVRTSGNDEVKISFPQTA